MTIVLSDIQVSELNLKTTNVAEAVGGPLYFTDARAKTAAVLNTLGGSETDQAPSVSAVNDALALKADDADVVKTVNSLSPTGGAITLDSDDVAEGTVNQYFTEARARLALSVAAPAAPNGNGDLSYNNLTGEFTYTPPAPVTFTEVNDLTAAVTWDNVPDANITETSVTQHQAALSLTSSQITDLNTILSGYAPVSHTHVATDITNFDTAVSTNTAVAANTTKVSADGSIDTHSDVNTATKADGQVLTWNNTAGEWQPTTVAAGGGSDLAVENENTLLTAAATKLNFTGAGVTATNAGTEVTVNIPGGGGGGLTLVSQPTLGAIEAAVTYSPSEVRAFATNGTITVAATASNGLWYSTDEGLNWAQGANASDPSFSSRNFSSVIYQPTNSTFYAYSNSAPASSGFASFSTDGINWVNITNSPNLSTEANLIPVTTGSGELIGYGVNGVYKYTSAGGWVQVLSSGSLGSASRNSYGYDPIGGGIFIQGTSNAIAFSPDHGSTWTGSFSSYAASLVPNTRQGGSFVDNQNRCWTLAQVWSTATLSFLLRIYAADLSSISPPNIDENAIQRIVNSDRLGEFNLQNTSSNGSGPQIGKPLLTSWGQVIIPVGNYNAPGQLYTLDPLAPVPMQTIKNTTFELDFVQAILETTNYIIIGGRKSGNPTVYRFPKQTAAVGLPRTKQAGSIEVDIGGTTYLLPVLEKL